MAVVACLGYATFVEPNLLSEQKYSFSQDVPAAFKGKKIVFLSDFHGSAWFGEERAHKVVDRVNRLEPDIVILGGDYIDHGIGYAEPIFEELKNIQAPLGKFAVLGNHDQKHKDKTVREKTISLINQAGFTSLINKAEWVQIGNDRIKLGGVGELKTDYQNIQPTIKDTQKNDLVILVSHNPDYAQNLFLSWREQFNLIDLVLAGHTHGGQVTLFGFWAPVIPSKFGQKFRGGQVDLGESQVIVSRGLGEAWLPLRFGARPEIVVVTLQ